MAGSIRIFSQLQRLTDDLGPRSAIRNDLLSEVARASAITRCSTVKGL